jgi:hypothetical protein
MRHLTRKLVRGLLVVLPTLFAGGCAKISAPVGAVIDREPPEVAATEPEQFAVTPGWDRPVVIKFNERISEKGIEGAVLVSPETGAVRVKKGRSELRVSVEGGWRAGQVYRVVVLPTVQDLFNDRLQHEIEVIFSTGPEIPATALAGLIEDRLTGSPVAGARVEAIGRTDSVRYVALSDTAGFFALRHIPAADYSLHAYLDRNRNGRLDFGEPQDTSSVMLSAADTTIVSYALLAADTTPARLVRAEERDSLELRLTLDDYLDPLVPLSDVQVEIRELPDSLPVPGARVMHLHAYERWRMARKAADSTSAVVDSVGAGLEPPLARTDSLAARSVQSPALPDTTTPLPTRELVVIPDAPLARKTRYLITLSGIRNINDVGGGGGSATFETAAAIEVPDSVDMAPGDTLGGAPPDSAGLAPPDSTGPRPVGADTLPPPDSIGPKPAGSDSAPPPDSTGPGPVIPDTLAPPPDSSSMARRYSLRTLRRDGVRKRGARGEREWQVVTSQMKRAAIAGPLR